MTMGERLKQLRELKNLTQEDVGDVIGVNKAAIQKYESGKLIEGLDDVEDGEVVFHAGTKLEQGRLVTSGGRVLGVTALGCDASSARYAAYAAAGRIHFEHAFCRRDIGVRAIATAEQGEKQIDG